MDTMDGPLSKVISEIVFEEDNFRKCPLVKSYEIIHQKNSLKDSLQDSLEDSMRHSLTDSSEDSV